MAGSSAAFVSGSKLAAALCKVALKSSAPSPGPSTESTNARSASNTQARELRRPASIGDQGLGTRVRQPVGDRIRPEQRRERQRDRAKLVDRDMDRGDLRHLRQHQRDPIAAPDAVRSQRIGEPVRQLAQRAVSRLVEAPVGMLVHDRDPIGSRSAQRSHTATAMLNDAGCATETCGRSYHSRAREEGPTVRTQASGIVWWI